MSKEITLNTQQSLYVIPCGDGYTCFGFQNAHDHCEQIATALGRNDLMPTPEVFGTLPGYALYLRAVDAWAKSLLSKKTYFDPGTDQKVCTLLEKYRLSGKILRVFYGDPETGRDSCEEWEVVGRVGRSNGMLKVPLLLVDAQDYGSALMTNRLVRIMDVVTNKDNREKS